MTRHVAAFAVGAALAVALVLLVVTQSPHAASSARTVSGMINVTATLTDQTSRHVSPRGRVGNVSTQAWRVTNRHGHWIGRLVLACRWVVADERYCTGELQLPLGKIAVAGASPTPLEGEFAVLGGTDVYRGAGGSMVWFAIGVEKHILLVNVNT